MKRFACLREISVNEAELQRLYLRLRATHDEVWRAPPPAGSRLLRFRLYGDGGSVTCLVLADAWANAHFPELAGIAWSAVPPSHLRSLAAGVDLPLRFLSPQLHYYRADLVDVMDNALQGDLRSPHAVACRAEEATVYLEQAPSWRRDGPAHLRLESALARVPVAVKFLYGSSMLSARLIARLRVGDALLVEKQLQAAMHCAHFLFSFRLAESSLFIEDIIMQQTPRSAFAHTEQDRFAGLGELPLSVEFVLARKDYLLGQLGALESGQLVELPADVAQRIEIVVNGRIAAIGELVQVENRLAVQIASLCKA